ncbi:MAG: hypothetical protein DMG30_00475 [Acidobacteria bacterium]|nr:MAG: hypothetical protein DMG30_00475 [Acidobacteriota bacterium]
MWRSSISVCPKGTGLEAAREILRNLPQTKILIRKGESERDLIPAIKTLLSNKAFYPSVMTTNIHRLRKRDRGKPQPRLTTRQREVVKLLAQGLHSEKIAEMLGISKKTVETHRIYPRRNPSL